MPQVAVNYTSVLCMAVCPVTCASTLENNVVAIVATQMSVISYVATGSYIKSVFWH